MVNYSVIQQLIATACPHDIEEITPNKHLVSELELDSFGLMELVLAFESEYNIEIPDRDLRNFDTVQNIVDYIEQKLSGATLVRA